MEAPMNNLYIGLLRLENRAAFFVLAKASQVTQRETAEERLQMSKSWSVCKSIDALSIAITLQIIYTTALRR